MTNKAVFLDRDGTVNEEVNYLSSIEQIKILPKASKAIKLLNENGFKVIIITNQSGVARGYFSIQTLKGVHDHLQNLLFREGAKIDAIYFCPHHPDDGCSCRKPKTESIKKAQDEFKIDLSKSYMIGDKYIDLETGHNAGLKTVLVLTGYGADAIQEKENWRVQPDHIAQNLFDAVIWILEGK
ncbi:MAG: D-glycero-beta-D-manno-heptose 1,7-bisphosphate 7-phosphatase [Methanomassiliicoccales archaeon]|nr:MAG: D-glycero-beta-D-manno-heptose 1,7-bisphosphate 7-phosphatase [Methanomassiliicoccales archaeon]